MKEYEVLMETIKPCGSDNHQRTEFFQVQTNDPVSYALGSSPYPLLDTGKNADGHMVVTTGDGRGSIVRYTFTT